MYICKKQNVTVQVVDLACGDVAVADFLFANGTVFTRQHCLRCKPRVTTIGVSFLSFSKHPSTACAQCLFTARSELRKVLFLTPSMTFLFVYEISWEPLNGFAPNSQGRRVWSLARTSLNVKVKGQRLRSPGTKTDFFRPFQRPVCGLCLVKHLVQFPFSELRFDSWNFNRIRNGASSIRQPDTHKNRIIMLVDNSKARYTLPMSTDPVHGRIHGPWTRPVNTGIVCTELKVDLVIYSATNKQTWMSYISLNDTMTRILKFPVLIYLGVGLN